MTNPPFLTSCVQTVDASISPGSRALTRCCLHRDADSAELFLLTASPQACSNSADPSEITEYVPFKLDAMLGGRGKVETDLGIISLHDRGTAPSI